MKIEARGCEIEIGRGILFLSVPGAGEIYAEAVTNAEKPRTLEVYGTETGAMIVQWGTWHVTLSPCPISSPAVPL